MRPRILDLLDLNQGDGDRFFSVTNENNVYNILFGGQILAQALAAADRTVGDRAVHSLHCYFIRAGQADQPVEYAVERLRDGGRFSMRRVVVRQGDSMLASIDCSYRVPLQGVSHQTPPGATLSAEGAIDIEDLLRSGREDLAPLASLFSGHHPVEVRIPGEKGFFQRGDTPERHYWLRAPGLDRAQPAQVHRQALAFMSDLLLSGAPLVPHTVALPGPHLVSVSLDHALWFHRPVRADGWLLFETFSPSAEGGANLACARVYDETGALVATAAQESFQQIVG